MKKIILFIALLLISTHAAAQTYDLIRSIRTGEAPNLIDTASDDFTHTGTMVIANNIVKRDTKYCRHQLCMKPNFNTPQEIISIPQNGSSVLLHHDVHKPLQELLTI